MTTQPTAGLHHVTALCSEPQANIDFYVRVLGLRLVKLTVNFDDPSSYHLYYGDATGRPGTIVTFFAWPGARRARNGKSVVTATAFAVPQGSLAWWEEHLSGSGVIYQRGAARLGEANLTLTDPDGMVLELIESPAPSGSSVANSVGCGLPAEVGITGLHSVTLAEDSLENTARTLTEILGYTSLGPAEEGEPNRHRFVAATGQGAGQAAGQVDGQPASQAARQPAGQATIVDVLVVPQASSALGGVGGVHHVAFRVPDGAGQRDQRSLLQARGYGVSPVMDRTYFQSIYFREPGGVLFEIATDTPGFAVDEAEDLLGTALKLPPQFEAHRARIEKSLTPVQLGGGK